MVVNGYYNGGPPPLMENCTYTNCNFDLGGAALQTVSYLEVVYHMRFFGWEHVEIIAKQIIS